MPQPSFNKVAELFSFATLLKRDANTGFFPVEFAKFLRTSILKYICERPTACLIRNMTCEFPVTLSIFLFYVIPQQTLKFKSKFRQWVYFWRYLTKDSLCWTFFSRANEVKTCGLVQQLILRMLRDLFLQSRNSHSLNGDPPLKLIRSK